MLAPPMHVLVVAGPGRHHYRQLIRLRQHCLCLPHPRAVAYAVLCIYARLTGNHIYMYMLCMHAHDKTGFVVTASALPVLPFAVSPFRLPGPFLGVVVLGPRWEGKCSSHKQIIKVKVAVADRVTVFI